VSFASLLVYGFSVLLKPLAEAFAWSRETTATAYACFALASALAAPIVGRLLTGWLLDRFRATYVAAALLTLAAAGILLLATAHTFELALVAAVMIGFGMGGELDVTPFLLSRYFGLQSLSTLSGFAWTAMGAGAGCVPSLLVAVLMLCLPPYGLLIDEQPVSADLRG
jgi:MFS family permease